MLIDHTIFEWYHACPLVQTDYETTERLLKEFINDFPPTAEAQVAAYLAGRR